MLIGEISAEDKFAPLPIISKKCTKHGAVGRSARQSRPSRRRPLCLKGRISQNKGDLRLSAVSKIGVQVALARQRAELPAIPADETRINGAAQRPIRRNSAFRRGRGKNGAK